MPEPTTIEPPVIAGAKPSTPAAAAASAEQAVTSAKAETPKPFNDAFAELDGLDVPAATPPPKPKAEPPPKPVAPPKEPPKAKELEPPKPPAAEPPKPPTATDERPIEKMAPKELREAYHAVKAETKKLREELETVRKAKPADDPEKKALVEAIERDRKRLQELEQEMAFVDYTKSNEFKETYQKPYEDAWARAVSDLEQLNVVNPETEEVRKATVQDMIALSNMDLGEAWKKATEWFGPAANSIMHHRDVIRDLHAKQAKALEQKKTEGTEHQKRRQAEMAEHQTKLNAAWTSENERVKTKYPAFFAEDPEDPEGNAILAKGFEQVDKMFTGNGLKPEEAVALHAAVRNKAAAFGRLVHRNKKLSTRVAELEKELADFKASTPRAGDGGSREQGGTDTPQSWEAEIDAMDSRK